MYFVKLKEKEYNCKNILKKNFKEGAINDKIK